MSTFYEIERICAICKKSSKQVQIKSTNAFGSSDLDSRPPQMQRSTMVYWIEVCPSCGYVAATIDEPTKISADFIEQERYQTCDFIEFESGLAKQFYRYYLINLELKLYQEAFLAVLHAAWACDDVLDRENAKTCRKLALDLIDNIDSQQEEKENFLLIKVDLLRRTGQFEQLLNICQTASFSNDMTKQILFFQKNRAQIKDTNCYTIKDAIEGIPGKH